MGGRAMEACGIDVFDTARKNGFTTDLRGDGEGGFQLFGLVLVE